MDEIIDVIIDGEGNIEMKTIGIKGKVCDGVVNKILVGVGVNDVNTQHTSEYYEDGDNPVGILTKE